MNEGLDIYCESVKAQVYTVVGLLVELFTATSKSKGSIEEYPSIR